MRWLIHAAAQIRVVMGLRSLDHAACQPKNTWCAAPRPQNWVEERLINVPVFCIYFALPNNNNNKQYKVPEKRHNIMKGGGDWNEYTKAEKADA
jgi:hypothetical protein